MKNDKQSENEFHSVEFMRQVRSELTEQYLHDKKKYLEYLNQVMENFKLRQKKASEKVISS